MHCSCSACGATSEVIAGSLALTTTAWMTSGRLPYLWLKKNG
jgi:hypothetical protein